MNTSKISKNSHAEYVRRITKVLHFIDKNIDKTIQLADVANVSCFSSFHFHRIFHALVGETVNEYVSRKRMEKAVSRLVNKPKLSITSVAEEGGFSSCANFSKAFKIYFGMSPSELRNSAFLSTNKDGKVGKLYNKYGKVFNPKDLYSQFETFSGVFGPDKLEETLMNVKIIEQHQKDIAYLISPNGYDLDSIFITWDKIVNWAENKGIECSTQTRFAICHDNPVVTPEEKCRYDAAIEITSNVDVAKPYHRGIIDSGKYAVAYFKDDANKISHFMTELCSQWFPNSGYEPDDQPPIFNYLNDSRKDGYVEMHVYIKIKPLTIN